MPSHNSSFVIPVHQPISESWNVVWALHSPAGRTLVCSLYPAGQAFEVRVGFPNEPALRTELVATKRAGASVARTVKMIALSNGFLKANTKCRAVVDPHGTSEGSLR